MKRPELYSACLWVGKILLSILCFSVPFSAVPIHAQSEETPEESKPRAVGRNYASLEQLESRSAALQERIDSLTAARTRLIQDSGRLASESQRLGSSLSKQSAAAYDSLTKKKEMAASLRAQYDKARRDSIDLASKHAEQLAAVHRELARLESSIIAMSTELEQLSTRGSQLGKPTSAADERTVASLQKAIAKRDSSLRARQAALEECNGRFDRLRQDSLQAEGKRTAARFQFHSRIAHLDSAIAACDSIITRAEKRDAGIRSERERKTAQLSESLRSASAQRRGHEEQIARLNTELSTLSSEKRRLMQSAGAAQTRYQNARAPYDQALTKAENEAQLQTKEKNLLQALRRKLHIDSGVAKVRDALDQAIQGEAENKKGAKKLVEQKEAELDSLLSVLDGMARGTPGLKQREALLRGITLFQKTASVDSILAGIDKRIAAAAMQREKTRKAIADFDAKNPKPGDASAIRLRYVDSMAAVRKKEIIRLTESSDSLNVVVQELQNSSVKLAANAATGGGREDSLISVRREEKNRYTAQRSKIIRDSIQNESASTGGVMRTKSDIVNLRNSFALIQNDIARLTVERDKAKQLLAEQAERNSQAQSSVQAEKKKNDSLIAIKQQAVTFASMKSEKIRQDSIALARKLSQQMKSITPAPSVLWNSLNALVRETAPLQAQSDSLKHALTTSQPQTGAAIRNYAQQIASLTRKIDAANSELASLSEQKEKAYGRLQNEKGRYDSLVSSAEQQLSAAISKRDKARQDSISYENAVLAASQKVSSGIKEKDSAVALRQRELADLNGAYVRSRDDSVRIAERIPAALQPFGDAIKNIDQSIAAREREIVELRAKRDKARQDSVQEYKRQNALLVTAHAEILAKINAMDRKRAEISLAMSDKKRTQQDTLSYRQKLKTEINANKSEIARLNAMIDKKKTELARYQKERDAAAARIKPGSETPPARAIEQKNVLPAPVSTGSSPAAASPSSTTRPAAEEPASASKGLDPGEIAQKRSEEIYTLLGENKMADAAKRFRQQQAFLKANLDADAFQTLKNTLEQMGVDAAK